MSRKIIAFAFLIFAVFISVFASLKVQDICDNATEKIDKIIEASEIDTESAKAQTQSLNEYWQKNSTVLKIFAGTEETLNVKLSIDEMLSLLEQGNIEDFLEETAVCNKSLFQIAEFAKFSLAKTF